MKSAAFAAMARALTSCGRFLIFGEAYPETDEALRTTVPERRSGSAWYAVTWGNVVKHPVRHNAGLQVTEETGFPRFQIPVAAKE